MRDGVDFELLLQLFFVLEGLALWKVPTPTATTITDFQEADDAVCERILSGDGTASERSKRSSLFLEASRKYQFWRGVASCLCSFIPLFVFALLIIVLGIFFNVKEGACLFSLNLTAIVYFFTKSFIVCRACYFVKKYDLALKNIVPVQKTTKPNNLESV